ncbi:MAG: metal-sensing transcriptional repressor [Eubacteriales bacterium]|jgi:DNA-binding FrmR family transcriptional regulator
MKKSDEKTESGKPETEAYAVPDCCRHKTKERSEKEYKDLVNRLSRIEGQVRGVRKMLDENAYCIDIITQVAAINAALNSFNKVLLTNHMETCVMDEVREGKSDKMEELIRILPKLMK